MSKLQPEIKEIITDFRESLDSILRDKVHGLYIYNSVAMGKFEPTYSDIDTVVLLKDGLSKDELDKLEKLHNRLSKAYIYGSKLDGMYLQYSNIGKSNKDMSAYPYFEGSDFYRDSYYDVNNVTWWSLKKYGLAIDSPSLVEELKSFSWDKVVSTMDYNINQYWNSKLENKENFIDDMWVEFGVVTLSRIAYTLDKKCLTSKSEACNHMLKEHMEWSDIINEALAIRNNKPKSVIKDEIARRDRCVEYLSYMINYTNSLL